MMTGLAHARGDLVFLLDSDLEEEPELLQTFYEEMTSAREPMWSSACRNNVKGRLFERVSGALYFKVFNLFSSYPIPTNHITARLMTRAYVAA